MSEIDEAAAFATPDRVIFAAYEGWDFLEGEGPSERRDQWPDSVGLVRTKAGDIPERFHLVVFDGKEQLITLYFTVDAGELRMQMAGDPIRGEVDDALTRLKSIRPMRFWRTRAVQWALLRAEMERARRIQGVPRGEPIRRLTEGEMRDFRTGFGQAKEFAASSKRESVTPELLARVAEVYRAAYIDGRNPTLAVAAHFQRPRSTAARWVGLARKAGKLGPASGPRRAGEAPIAGSDG